ncbi:MAG: UDP-glucose 4-epimerase GalE [Rhodocyclaceae bacterium]|nr:UDP-glucose 4-epimerase GalE [Rhodocyclaceae bacterium]
MRKVFVVGGGGYIGSHMVKQLVQAGHQVVVGDNFSTGFRDAISGASIIEVDIGDQGALDDLFSTQEFDAVIHFASFIQVGESVLDPAKYYGNNLAASLALLRAMVKAGILNFVFSSTAAVYGNPVYVPIDEEHPKAPINPYGLSKWMVEQILRDFERAYGLKSAVLRYFNAAGADPEGCLGERHEPETHLIPLILQAASGRRKAITVFGRDYDTPDGTCIRDYVHVTDLVQAHARALDYLWAGNDSAVFNLGNGAGFSVQEVIETARRVTGREFAVSEAPRRSGDPARLVADSRRARETLGWRPIYPDLETIIKHAWQWELRALPK